MTKLVSQYFDLLLNLNEDWQVLAVETNFTRRKLS